MSVLKRHGNLRMLKTAILEETPLHKQYFIQSTRVRKLKQLQEAEAEFEPVSDSVLKALGF